MNRRVWMIAALLAAILPAVVVAQTTEQNVRMTPITDAPYGYVELVGPRTYSVVEGDTLWDLNRNDWQRLQQANPKLSEAERISTTATGLYRVLLKVTEPIQIPAGMTIRVRLTRPTNFVDSPVTGGQPFVQGGVNTDDQVRRQLREQALRDFGRVNGQNTLRSEDFQIVGPIERGRLYGPGIVNFADRPNEGRPTIYRGELGYRATVRNRRTGQWSEQMFLQGCANDARRGEFLQAGGEGFRFEPNGTIPGDPAPAPNGNERVQQTWWQKYKWPLAIGLLTWLVVFFGQMFQPTWFGLAAAGTVAPSDPPAPVAAAVTETNQPAAEPEPEAQQPAAVPIALATARTEPELETAVINGTTYHYSSGGTLHVEKGGKVRIEGAAITETIAPNRTKPKRVRASRQLPGAATGTDPK